MQRTETMRKIMFMCFAATVALSCSGPGLSVEERAKLDPVLQELVSGQTVSEQRYDVTVRPDGTKEYGVIVRTDAPDDVRALGVAVGSVFGDVVTVRVTPDELRRIAALKTVKSVQNSGKNLPH